MKCLTDADFETFKLYTSLKLYSYNRLPTIKFSFLLRMPYIRPINRNDQNVRKPSCKLVFINLMTNLPLPLIELDACL